MADDVQTTTVPSLPQLPTTSGGAPAMSQLMANLKGIDPYTLNALAVLRALQDQKQKEREAVPFMQPGKAMVENNLAAKTEGYAPSGIAFAGGVPYKPNYGAQDVAAAGMLISNLLDIYKKNRQGRDTLLEQLSGQPAGQPTS